MLLLDQLSLLSVAAQSAFESKGANDDPMAPILPSQTIRSWRAWAGAPGLQSRVWDNERHFAEVRDSIDLLSGAAEVLHKCTRQPHLAALQFHEPSFREAMQELVKAVARDTHVDQAQGGEDVLSLRKRNVTVQL